jgi:hypothetical protein
MIKISIIILLNLMLIIRCRGTRTIIKTTFEAIICDDKILQGLAPLQACFLGGYIGRALRAKYEKKIALRKINKMSFLLKNTSSRYRLVYQNRSGEVAYYDRRFKQEYVEHPITVSSNELIITNFDSSQACYIGILAGISMEKAVDLGERAGTNKFNEIMNLPPKLRLIN